MTPSRQNSFSIITPARNGASNLRRCIGSVRGQTGVIREHIIRDSSSIDGTVKFLSRTAPGGQLASPPYRLTWVSEPDGGMYDAIQKGWETASGQFLSWLNVDEQYLPGTLETVLQAFTMHPKVDVIFGDTIVVDGDGNPVAARREIPLRELYLRNGFLYALSCATFFRRRLLESGQLSFASGFRMAADMELMLRLLRHGARVMHLGGYLSLFGVDGKNLSVTHADQGAREAAEIYQLYGALPRWARGLPMLGRRLERLVRGCYRSERVAFDFAEDEIPNYRHVQPTKLGSRFTFF